MTLSEKSKYDNPDHIREIFKSLKGRKFRLDCGHHVTLGHNLSNNIVIRHDGGIDKIRIECTLCSY